MRRGANSRWNEATIGFLTIGTLLAVATTAGTFISAELIADASLLPFDRRIAAGYRLIFYFMVAVSLVAYMCALAVGAQVPFLLTAEEKREKASQAAWLIVAQGIAITMAVLLVLVVLARLDFFKYLSPYFSS